MFAKTYGIMPPSSISGILTCHFTGLAYLKEQCRTTHETDPRQHGGHCLLGDTSLRFRPRKLEQHLEQLRCLTQDHQHTAGKSLEAWFRSPWPHPSGIPHHAPGSSGCRKASYQDHLFLRGAAGPRYWRGNYPVYLVMITESLTSQRLSPNTLRSYLHTIS